MPTPTLVFNAQQTLTPLPLIGGFGQEASDFVSKGQTTFGAPLDRAQAWGGGVTGLLSGNVPANAMLIIQGTYTPGPDFYGGVPWIDTTGPNFESALLYSDIEARTLTLADGYRIGPEPASIALLVMGGVVIMRRRVRG